jgi:hypothetical protein
MLNTTLRTAVFALAMTTVVPLAARAADPAFCAGYADAAINQVRGALSNPNCAARRSRRPLVTRTARALRLVPVAARRELGCRTASPHRLPA